MGVKRVYVGWRKPKQSCRMTTSSFVEGGHDEAPLEVLRVLVRTEIEPLAAGGNRGGQLLQEVGKPHGEQMGVEPGDGQITGQTPGAARRPASQAPPPNDLRHPDLLSRGVNRGARGQHERPVDGPATGMAADPTAGCGVSGDGYGYPDHVGTFLLAKRVLGRLSDPHYKVRRPRGPSRLVQGRSTGPLFLINAEDHPTVPAEFRVPQVCTCRKAGRPLTAHHGEAPSSPVRSQR